MEYQVHVTIDDSLEAILDELSIYEFEEDWFEQDYTEDTGTGPLL
jgi:hypothetical protein